MSEIAALLKCPPTCVACAAIAAGRSVHCWEDGPIIHIDDGTPYGQDLGSTCMLEHAHLGDHEFLSDDRIKLSFAAEPPLKAVEIPAIPDSKG